MRRVLAFLAALVLAFPFVMQGARTQAFGLRRAQETSGEGRRVLTVQGRRRRRVRSEFRRRRGIKSAFARAGRGAGRGGRRFGQNVARGRLARGGKELGKGMGTFGKHTAKGVARSVRRAVTP